MISFQTKSYSCRQRDKSITVIREHGVAADQRCAGAFSYERGKGSVKLAGTACILEKELPTENTGSSLQSSQRSFNGHITSARSGQSLEGWTHFNTRLRSGSVEVRLIRSRPRFAIKLWEFIEQIIRGEHDAAWYGRESLRATAHARISRRRISRHPIRGPS